MDLNWSNIIFFLSSTTICMCACLVVSNYPSTKSYLFRILLQLFILTFTDVPNITYFCQIVCVCVCLFARTRYWTQMSPRVSTHNWQVAQIYLCRCRFIIEMIKPQGPTTRENERLYPSFSIFSKWWDYYLCSICLRLQPKPNQTKPTESSHRLSRSDGSLSTT